MNDTGPHLGKSKQNQEISEFKILVGKARNARNLTSFKTRMIHVYVGDEIS
jgi:hypothetical protein